MPPRPPPGRDTSRQKDPHWGTAPATAAGLDLIIDDGARFDRGVLGQDGDTLHFLIVTHELAHPVDNVNLGLRTEFGVGNDAADNENDDQPKGNEKFLTQPIASLLPYEWRTASRSAAQTATSRGPVDRDVTRWL
jgi:hypothetical protein